MNYTSPGSFSSFPPVIKNLIIINGLMFLLTFSLKGMGLDLNRILGLYIPESPMFEPIQFISYIFMHGGFEHILINMFMLWMLGNTLENIWGSKRFLMYYLITGLGGGILHVLAKHIEFSSLSTQLSSEELNMLYSEGARILGEGKNWSSHILANANLALNTPTVGASGAVFGILLAFGMMFPNQYIYVYFIIPIRTKYFVIIIGSMELIRGLTLTGGNVANFAHLGGMVFGFVLIKYWKAKGNMM
ncbi:rhomboid family intramembrane serine protease [Ichthyobacterium seriolicida]|uniref:Integral membrane rhomboid family serine protease n=1 Tax=Ichthyobacterium seriolicida TaxID=242600 RepID=A0A1J1DWD8_9FLAO|nr:rhomboid family intramembrane serine protease [Ichthyobacterium seriolicida]BAV94177.1 integral membrane rhomboid family serine protease [Ichthyobacterium seriolicida]